MRSQTNKSELAPGDLTTLPAILLSRRSQGSFDRPSQLVETTYQAAPSDACFYAPLSDGLRFPSKSKETVRRLITNLFVLCSPLDVTRFVISVIVNSFKSVIVRRTKAHILKEIDKPILAKPPIADPDSTSSVTMITFMRFVIATSYHATIYFVLGGIAHPVNSSAGGGGFRKQASTRTRLASQYAIGTSVVIAATIALAAVVGAVANGYYGINRKASVFNHMPSIIAYLVSICQAEDIVRHSGENRRLQMNEVWGLRKRRCNPDQAVQFRGNLLRSMDRVLGVQI